MEGLNVEDIKPDDEIGSIIHDGHLTKYRRKLVLIGKDRFCIPDFYLERAHEIKNLEVYNDDIWVITYPKCGTTWTQEMVWMIANDLDFEGAEKSLRERFPFLEFSTLSDMKTLCDDIGCTANEYEVDSVNFVNNLQQPRFIKTHLPFSLLPDQIRDGLKTPKMIYVVRNPKDACVSFYHHGSLSMGWKLDINDHVKVFMAGKTMFGSYWKHIFDYWKQRHLPNFLVIKYEDMKSDIASVVKRVAQFLDKELTDEQVHLLCKHLSFESMRSNAAVNGESSVERLRSNNLVVKDGSFIRSGKVGQYKEELRPETVARLNEWVASNVKGTELEKEDIFQI